MLVAALKMWQFLLILQMFVGLEAKTVVYDSYYGTAISNEEYLRHIKENTTYWCTIEVEDPCDPNEGRRLDGSCNNPKYPPRGTSHSPFLKLLAPEFGPDFTPRPDQAGEPMCPCRSVRTGLLTTGIRPHRHFTQLVTHFLVFMVADIVTVQDSVNYVLWKPYCCLPKGKTDSECVPQRVPDDDPVHRFSDIRCLNLTKTFSFQSRGCIKNDTAPDKFSSATPTFDLSIVYGEELKASLQKARLFLQGLLKYEVEAGRIYPPSTPITGNLCLLNQPPRETRCHDTPSVGANTVLGINLFTIWFWRNHNRIARTLAGLNPCWNDDKLFYTARDINIAVYSQIFIYELLPSLLGWNNLERHQVVSSSKGYRDMNDKNSYPLMSSEFSYSLRWFHTMQEGRLKMYDESGNYLKQVPVVNLTLRTGYLAIDDNLDHMTIGSFKQACANSDYTIDPDIGERIFGGLQRASDVATSDLAKGRFNGFPPYIKYVEFCSGRKIKSFDDLRDLIDDTNLELLRDKYRQVGDIELLAGIWMERPVSGGFVPSTLYCLMVDQLLRTMKTDRHWYERPNRPNAFTLPQLYEIRKASVAGLLCDVGDKVTKIQKRAFYRNGPGNKMYSCDKIEKIDLTAWKDGTCEVNKKM